MGVPRYFAPSGVIVTLESAKILMASSRCDGFVTVMLFSAFGKYPDSGPETWSLSHHSFTSVNFPAAAALSCSISDLNGSCIDSVV